MFVCAVSLSIKLKNKNKNKNKNCGSLYAVRACKCQKLGLENN
jgi:hypothetical protein